MPNLYSIYRIVNTVNGKCYVGQTNNPKRRHLNHFTALRKGMHSNRYLQHAWNKNSGDQNFKWELLEQNIAFEDVDARELYWIEKFDSFRSGYNATPNGKAVNIIHKKRLIESEPDSQSPIDDEEQCKVLEAEIAKLTSIHQEIYEANMRKQGQIELLYEQLRQAYIEIEILKQEHIRLETRLALAVDDE